MTRAARAWIEAQAPIEGDPAEWQGEAEPDQPSDPAEWPASMTRPTRAEGAELRRRHSPAELLELSRQPSLWNLAIAAMRAAPAILDSHRHDPPQPAEWPRAKLKRELRRQFERVLRAPAERREDLLRVARKDLEALIERGLHAVEIDEWNDLLRGQIDGR